jgi:hypothetical protein
VNGLDGRVIGPARPLHKNKGNKKENKRNGKKSEKSCKIVEVKKIVQEEE